MGLTTANEEAVPGLRDSDKNDYCRGHDSDSSRRERLLTEVPMVKKPTREEFVLDGPTAHHGPTGIEITFPYPDQGGSNRSVTYRRGNAGEYDEDEVVRMGAEILYLEVETWTCPLCDGKLPKDDRAKVIREYHEKCKLQEHSVGYECLAFRQESKRSSHLTIAASAWVRTALGARMQADWRAR
jgi:hypothetical protein